MATILELLPNVFIDVCSGIVAVFIATTFTHGTFSVPLFIFGICAALLPDIDFVLRFIHTGRVLDNEAIFHRDYLHFPLVTLSVGGATAIYFLGTGWGITFILAFLAHYIHDSVDNGCGVPWLWPFSTLRYQFFPPRIWTHKEILEERVRPASRI